MDVPPEQPAPSRPVPPRPPDRGSLARLRSSGKRGLWAVPEALKEEVLAQLWELLADPLASDRDKVAAARALGFLDKIDQADARRAPPAAAADARAAIARAVEIAGGRETDPDPECDPECGRGPGPGGDGRDPGGLP